MHAGDWFNNLFIIFLADSGTKSTGLKNLIDFPEEVFEIFRPRESVKKNVAILLSKASKSKVC